LGFSPRQIDELSLWEFRAVVTEYKKAHDPKAEKALSSSEEDALWRWMTE
jgi:hypothetical protein